MATLDIRDSELVLELTGWEKVAGLLGDLHLPLDDVRTAEVVADPLPLVRGLRAPGLDVPWRTKIGTWRQRRSRTVAVVRAGAPAVRVLLHGDPAERRPLRELVVDVPDPVAVVTALTAATAGRPARVREEAVAIHSADTRLAGTLTTPGAGPCHGTALLLTGSGEIDRDGDHAGLPLGISRELAHALADAGIASLRYDKRGVGASGGRWLETGFTDNVDDARAAVTWLTDWAAARPELAGRDPVVVGHSEGALQAVALGADPDLRLGGLVLLALPAQAGAQALEWQARQLADALPAGTRRVLRLLRVDVVAKHRAMLDRVRATTTDVARIQGRRVNARWMREALAHDPVPQLRRVRVPVLALTGTKDLQVDPAGVDVVAATVPAPVTAVRVPDLTHLLRRDPAAPSVTAYRRLAAEPMDAEVRQTVVDWVVAHAPGPGS
jgi:hypothetical protein